ncbi:hypothetical protein BDV10DRAFT_198508 [Aspergillus recurvatus]
MAWCCPCILFGKTQARLDDPTLVNYSPINENRLTWCGPNCCAASFLIQAKKRSDLRKRYGITETHLEHVLGMQADDIKRKHDVEGSLVEACLGSFCWPCCVLVQAEKEVVKRRRGMQYP